MGPKDSKTDLKQEHARRAIPCSGTVQLNGQRGLSNAAVKADADLRSNFLIGRRLLQMSFCVPCRGGDWPRYRGPDAIEVDQHSGTMRLPGPCPAACGTRECDRLDLGKVPLITAAQYVERQVALAKPGMRGAFPEFGLRFAFGCKQTRWCAAQIKCMQHWPMQLAALSLALSICSQLRSNHITGRPE